MKTFFKKLNIDDHQALFVIFFKYELLPNLHNFKKDYQIKKYISKYFKNAEIKINVFSATTPRKKNKYICL